MKVLLLVVLSVVAMAAARPSDVIDIEEDHMEHEQEGIPGTAVEGEYSWIAPDGIEYEVKYVADHRGYRIVDDNIVSKDQSLETNDNAAEEEKDDDDDDAAEEEEDDDDDDDYDDDDDDAAEEEEDDDDDDDYDDDDDDDDYDDDDDDDK